MSTSILTTHPAFGPEIEVWEVYPECDRYHVSTWGRVKLVKGNTSKAPGLCRLTSGDGGYLMVGINRRINKVHKLVLETFHRPRKPGEVCRHLDGDPKTNRLDNLRWGTPAENTLDACRHGTMARKLTPADVLEIRELAEAGQLSLSAIGDMYGIVKSTVWMIKNRSRWGWL